MLNRNAFTYFLVFFTLIFLSGGFIATFQLWVNSQVQQNYDSSQIIQGANDFSGIRSILSSPTIFSTSSASKEQNQSKYIPSVSYSHKESVSSFASSSVPVLNKQYYTPPEVVDLQPTIILYPNELILEFPEKIASKINIRRAIARLLLSANPLQEENLLSRQRMDLTSQPYFLYHVLDQAGQPIRFPKQAYDYANYLMTQHSREIQDEEGSFFLISIPVAEIGLKAAAKKYKEWVKYFAEEFNISPALIYAVIEVESSFNPLAVSRSNAIGLMQLKSATAGKDVFELVDGRSGKPSLDELFNAQNNIRMGTAYLGLLKHRFLSGIKNEKSKKMVAISSYNGGMGTVFRVFGSSQDEAINKINTLSPKQVYHKLRFEHESDETRRYLDKVLEAKIRYERLLSVRDINV